MDGADKPTEETLAVDVLLMVMVPEPFVMDMFAPAVMVDKV